MSKKIALFLVPYFVWSAVGFTNEAQDFISKGNSFVGEKKYQEALAEYEKAAKAEPKNAKATLLIGLSYANMGQLDLEYLLDHQEVIPTEWRGKYYLVAPGTVWQDSDGDLCVPYLDWDEDQWILNFDWRRSDWNGDVRLIRPRKSR